MSPATPEQLSSVRRIIYGILNQHNGRWYVGQTRRTFNQRYVGGQWWVHSTNAPLRNAYKRYGGAAFAVYLLASNVSTDELMDELEKRFISQYCAVFPHGYCFEAGGQQYGKRINPRSIEKQRQAMLKLRARSYVLLDANEVEHHFSNIVVFAREHGLNEQVLANLLRGHGRRHRGWHLPGIRADQWTPSATLKTVIAPDGTEHSFYNTAAFAREHGLEHSCLMKLTAGEQRQHKGWQLKGAKVKPVGYNWRNENNRHKRYERIVLERDGQLYTITNDIAAFCATHGLTKREVYTLTKGDQKTTHGFRLVRVDYTNAYLAKQKEAA